MRCCHVEIVVRPNCTIEIITAAHFHILAADLERDGACSSAIKFLSINALDEIGSFFVASIAFLNGIFMFGMFRNFCYRPR